MSVINKLISGWTILKFVRVGLGSLILYSSIESGQVIGIIVGGLLTTISLFTDGVCCAVSSCYSHSNKNNLSLNETIEYEELGAK